MNAKNVRLVGLLLLGICAPRTAFAQELLEKVVVRNRLHTLSGRWEAGANVGFTLVTRLTEHYNLNAHVAYNTSDTFAFELRAGYALARQTGLATQVADEVYNDPPRNVITELSHLWVMQGNGILGVRWAPLYGKLSLMAEVPVHFQTYLWLGAGAAQFQRESLVYCQAAGVDGCQSYQTQQRVGAVGSVAVGMRFWVAQGHSIGIEARDYSWPDSYLADVDRTVALSGGQTGTPVRSPEITNLVLLDLGYSYIF